MYKTLATLGALATAAFLTPQAANAAVCLNGANLGVWVSTAGFSCTIGDKTFSNFTYTASSGGGATPVAAADIAITTINNGASAIGFQFSAPWVVASTQSLDSLIGFNVAVTPPTGGVFIHDASLVQGGTSFSGAGVASVSENLSNLTTLLTITAAGQTVLSDQATFSNTGSVGVTKDIAVRANGGSASISLVDDTFSQTTVAEPASLAILGGGLLSLGLLRQQRRRR
jgi:hypothetical protein